MGGGAGVSLHGRFRVATDNTVCARNQTYLTFFIHSRRDYVLMKLETFIYNVLHNINIQA
jgi:3-hydroxyisobutyryl-CoA hydrolase